LADNKRITFADVTDDEAVEAFQRLCRLEGIIPALESSHAVAYLEKIKKEIKGKTVVINLSGRGDKDMHTISDYLLSHPK
jgi:tryptophan synthase beta subunit